MNGENTATTAGAAGSSEGTDQRGTRALTDAEATGVRLVERRQWGWAASYPFELLDRAWRERRAEMEAR